MLMLLASRVAQSCVYCVCTKRLTAEVVRTVTTMLAKHRI